MGQEGLILIEAKAHANELSTKGKKEGGHPANELLGMSARGAADAGSTPCPTYAARTRSALGVLPNIWR
jgi:hypothetical protein